LHDTRLRYRDSIVLQYPLDHSGVCVIQFDKWYLDLTADDGVTVIVYWAQLRGLGVSITWSSRLVVIDDEISTRSSLAHVPPPMATGGMVSWTHARLGVQGRWQAQQHEQRRKLLDLPAGIVAWNCLAPRAEVSLQLDDRTLHGLGYVERLTMTIEPWKLPINELRWGRFLAADHDVVWIQWLGAHPLSLVIANGSDVASGTIHDHQVQFDGGHVDMMDSFVLREGKLGPTVLNAIPGIHRITPASMLAAHETKWRSKGVLHMTGLVPTQGWVIHEVVTFRKGCA